MARFLTSMIARAILPATVWLGNRAQYIGCLSQLPHCDESMDSTTTLATASNDAAVESPRHSSRRSASANQLQLPSPKPEFAESATATDLAARLLAYQRNGEADGSLIIRNAYAIAREAHEGQKRVSGEPYIDHPVSVANILLDLRMDPASIAAALLHDVVEDTSITKE